MDKTTVASFLNLCNVEQPLDGTTISRLFLFVFCFLSKSIFSLFYIIVVCISIEFSDFLFEANVTLINCECSFYVKKTIFLPTTHDSSYLLK